MQQLFASLESRSFEIVAILTALITVVYGSDQWPMTTFGTVLLISGVLARKLLSSHLFWLLFTGIAAFTYGLFWFIEGDGLVLLTYWCLAILLSTSVQDRDVNLAEMARLLIGVVFLLAVIGKLISPDFMSGAFYEFFLVRDFGRVAMIGIFLTDLSISDAVANVKAVAQLPEQGVTLISAPGIRPLASALTALTLVVEGAVVAAFLLKAPAKIRDGVFILFLAGTYLIAPVVVLGVTLSIMGFAQASSSKVRAIYLFLILFIQLTPLRTHIALLFMT